VVPNSFIRLQERHFHPEGAAELEKSAGLQSINEVRRVMMVYSKLHLTQVRTNHSHLHGSHARFTCTFVSHLGHLTMVHCGVCCAQSMDVHCGYCTQPVTDLEGGVVVVVCTTCSRRYHLNCIDSKKRPIMRRKHLPARKWTCGRCLNKLPLRPLKRQKQDEY
jgi:hypothetical protein